MTGRRAALAAIGALLVVASLAAACVPRARTGERATSESRAETAADPSRGAAADSGAENPVPYSWAERHRYIAHAMGKVGYHALTNSREAFEANYKLGIRVFETDFVFTRDGSLVARHDWTPERFERFQQKVPKGGVPTLAEFKAMPIRRTYTPLAAADVVALMRRYPDVWVMTDIKTGSVSSRSRGLRQLVEAMGDDRSLRSRLIVQIYEEADLAPVRALGIGNVVFTFYRLRTSPARALDFCRANGIRVVTFPHEMATRAFLGQVDSHGLIGATHTINTAEEEARYRDLGVKLFYTDILHP